MLNKMLKGGVFAKIKLDTLNICLTQIKYIVSDINDVKSNAKRLSRCYVEHSLNKYLWSVAAARYHI